MPVYLTEVSEKDKPWDRHRTSADLVQQLYSGTEYQKYADRIRECAQRLVFALTTSKTEDELIFKLTYAWFCRVRFCPVCCWRKPLRWLGIFLTALPKILAAYPSARWVFLTLTIRNCPIDELRDNISLLNKGFARLSQRKVYPALGHVKSLEVTRGKDGLAHPHLHVLMMVPSTYFRGDYYVNHEKWVQLWRSCCRLNYDPTVDIRNVRLRMKQFNNDKTAALSAALRETFKYTVKSKDLVADQSWLLSLTDQMQNVRSVAVSGVLRDFIRQPDFDKEDLIHLDEDSSEDIPSDAPHLTFNWSGVEKRYRSCDA